MPAAAKMAAAGPASVSAREFWGQIVWMICDWLHFLILMLCLVEKADRILIFTTTKLSRACQNTNAHFTPSANANGRAWVQ